MSHCNHTGHYHVDTLICKHSVHTNQTHDKTNAIKNYQISRAVDRSGPQWKKRTKNQQCQLTQASVAAYSFCCDVRGYVLQSPFLTAGSLSILWCDWNIKTNKVWKPWFRIQTCVSIMKGRSATFVLSSSRILWRADEFLIL